MCKVNGDTEQLVRGSGWIVRFIAHHKCLLSQGAAWVQVFIIFFVGATQAQAWWDKHYGNAPGIQWPFVAALIVAWSIGKFLEVTGLIGEEQNWYTSRNRTFKALEETEK